MSEIMDMDDGEEISEMMIDDDDMGCRGGDVEDIGDDGDEKDC